MNPPMARRRSERRPGPREPGPSLGTGNGEGERSTLFHGRSDDVVPLAVKHHVGLILSIPCEVASGSVNAGVGRSTLATCPVLRRSSHPMRSWYVFSGERRWPSGTIRSTAQIGIAQV